MTDEPTAETQPSVTNANPYRTGDPVMDCAQGRAMVVLDAPDQTVAEWSDANNYELTENYANGKFGAYDAEYVAECVYVSDVRSEPSKTYTFPASRLRLIDAHHADDGMRVADRVIAQVSEALFTAAIETAAVDPLELQALFAEAGVPVGPVTHGEDIAKATLGKETFIEASEGPDA